MNSPKITATAAVVCMLLGLTGCMGFSGSGQKTTNVPPPPDFSVTVNPTSAKVAQGASTSFTTSVQAQGSSTGNVQLAVYGLPSGVSASFSSSTVSGSGEPTLSLTASKSAAPGTYTLTISASSGTLTHNSTFSLGVTTTSTTPDFSLSTTPNTQTIPIGQSSSFSVNVAPINEFVGTVSLTATGLPAAMQASFSPASINSTGKSTLTVSTSSVAVAGTYTLTIAGTSGTLSHSVTVGVTLVAPDFSLTASPSAQTVTAGSNTSFTVSVAAIDGFAATVALAESGMPSGMLASCTPSSITKSGNCTLTVSTTSATVAGTYTLTIKGTSGTLSHSATVSVIVKADPADFSISTSPSSRAVMTGKSTTFTTTVTPGNGFTGAVALSATGMPSGVTATFSPTSITTSGSSTLTVTASSSTAAGTYTLTLTGKSSTLTHSTTVSLVVSVAPGAALNVLQFPGAGGDPWYKDIPKYLYTNDTVAGTTIGVEWGGSDQGPSAGSGQYNFTNPDAAAAPWIAIGKKVNFVVWANADNADNTCNTEAQYGSDNTGNCAIPAYVWNALGASNITVCTSQYGTQWQPNYFATAFQSNYQKFMAAMIQHYKGNASIGYIRFGLGHGGESFPVANWNDTTTACGQAFVNAWGLTIQTWESYLSEMLSYEGSLNSPVQLMVGITPMGNPGSQVPDFVAPIAVQNHIGFGSQGLELTDVNNCAGSTAGWCDLFNLYTGQVPLELQTYLQSCPDNSCTTGSLVDLVPFAVANHASVFEFYYQDWLTAYDPNYPGYYPAYQPILQAAAGK